MDNENDPVIDPSVIEQVENAIETAVIEAEIRADNAEQVSQILSESIIEQTERIEHDRLSQRVYDTEKRIEECHSTLTTMQATLLSMADKMTELSTSILSRQSEAEADLPSEMAIVEIPPEETPIVPPPQIVIEETENPPPLQKRKHRLL